MDWFHSRGKFICDMRLSTYLLYGKNGLSSKGKGMRGGGGGVIFSGEILFVQCLFLLFRYLGPVVEILIILSGM